MSDHTLNVVNAVDVPESVLSAVLALLAPFSPDVYSRPCDATGRAL
jgi:hypothetical protein